MATDLEWQQRQGSQRAEGQVERKGLGRPQTSSSILRLIFYTVLVIQCYQARGQLQGPLLEISLAGDCRAEQAGDAGPAQGHATGRGFHRPLHYAVTRSKAHQSETEIAWTSGPFEESTGKEKKKEQWQSFKLELKAHLTKEQGRFEQEMTEINSAIEETQLELDKLLKGETKEEVIEIDQDMEEFDQWLEDTKKGANGEKPNSITHGGKCEGERDGPSLASHAREPKAPCAADPRDAESDDIYGTSHCTTDGKWGTTASSQSKWSSHTAIGQEASGIGTIWKKQQIRAICQATRGRPHLHGWHLRQAVQDKASLGAQPCPDYNNAPMGNYIDFVPYYTIIDEEFVKQGNEDAKQQGMMQTWEKVCHECQAPFKSSEVAFVRPTQHCARFHVQDILFCTHDQPGQTMQRENLISSHYGFHGTITNHHGTDGTLWVEEGQILPCGLWQLLYEHL